MASPAPKGTSQASTRSNSKITGPLTLDAFNYTMAEHKKTQVATLNQCKLLCDSQATKFNELSESLALLSSQIVALKNDNDNLRMNISDLNKRVNDLEFANSSRPLSSAGTVQTILQEITERERCSRNIIIRGITESSSSVLEERISEDTSKIVKVIEPYFSKVPENLKSIRRGKPIDRGPRPLKVFFSSKEIASNLVSDFNKNARSLSPDSSVRSIAMTRDRTPLEHESIRLIYAELDNRKKNSETDLRIIYRGGFPFISPLNRTSLARHNHVSNSTHHQPNHSKN